MSKQSAVGELFNKVRVVDVVLIHGANENGEVIVAICHH